MKKTISFLIMALILASGVSAYSHAYFEVSDRVDYNSNIDGPNRGFSVQRSTDIPRLTSDGYWDWSATPKSFVVADTRISERVQLEAFRTFQMDSAAQNEIQRIKELRKFPYFVYDGRITGFSRFSFDHGYYDFYRPTARIYSYGF